MSLVAGRDVRFVEPCGHRDGPDLGSLEDTDVARGHSEQAQSRMTARFVGDGFVTLAG